MNPVRFFEFAWLTQQFLRELVLIYPVYAILMRESGVTAWEFSTLLAAWSFTVVIAEIPSGTLGDRVNRVHLIVASGVIKAIAFGAWLAWPTYWGFLAGFLIWGLGSTLRSGTEESLLHDTLAVNGALDRFEQIYGRGTAAGTAGTVVAFLLGGYLADAFGFELPLALSIAAPLAAGVLFGLMVKDAPRTGDSLDDGDGDPPGSYLATMELGFREVRSSIHILRIVAMASSLGCIWGVMDEFLPMFVTEKANVGLFAVGIIYALVAGASIVAVALAHRIPARTPASIATIFCAAGATLGLSVIVEGALSAALLIVSFGFNGAAKVLLDSLLQRSIRTHARATVTSVAGTGDEVFGVFLFLTGGAIANTFSWHTTTLVLALGGLAFVIVFWLWRSPRANPAA